MPNLLIDKEKHIETELIAYSQYSQTRSYSFPLFYVGLMDPGLVALTIEYQTQE